MSAIFEIDFSVFRFWCSLRFADIPCFSIWFSVFAKNTNGFSDLISEAVFGFSYVTDLGFRFLFDLSGNYAPPLISNSRETQTLSRGMRDEPIQILRGSLGLRATVPYSPRWGEGRVRLHIGYG